MTTTPDPWRRLARITQECAGHFHKFTEAVARINGVSEETVVKMIDAAQDVDTLDGVIVSPEIDTRLQPRKVRVEAPYYRKFEKKCGGVR